MAERKNWKFMVFIKAVRLGDLLSWLISTIVQHQNSMDSFFMIFLSTLLYKKKEKKKESESILESNWLNKWLIFRLSQFFYTLSEIQHRLPLLVSLSLEFELGQFFSNIIPYHTLAE